MQLDKVNYFSNVPEWHYFRTFDGKVLKSLSELCDFLRDCSNDSFSFHVDSNKNDFANWIKEIIFDVSLADEIRNIKDKMQMRDIILSKLQNSSNLFEIEQEILKKLNVLLSIIDSKEKVLKEKKESNCLLGQDLEEIAKLRSIRSSLIQIQDKLKEINSLDKKDSKEIMIKYSQISEELVHTEKILCVSEKNTKINSTENNLSKEERLLFEILKNIDSMIKTNHDLYDKRQTKLEQELIFLKKDADLWKIGDVADHQEIKSVFLAFEKNIDYRFETIHKLSEKIYDVSHVQEKIRRHTTIINNLDKEFFNLKKETESNTENIKKIYELLKLLTKKIKN
jgi:hypothetical protein